MLLLKLQCVCLCVLFMAFDMHDDMRHVHLNQTKTF